MKKLLMLVVLAGPALTFAGPQDEIKTLFHQFVTAQNAHDVKAVGDMLEDSPEFLWITRGNAIWGHQAAIDRFSLLYKNTWHLEPQEDQIRVKMLGDNAAQIYAPTVFTIGDQGQVTYMLNQTLIKTPSGWRIASIIPVLVPPPAK